MSDNDTTTTTLEILKLLKTVGATLEEHNKMLAKLGECVLDLHKRMARMELEGEKKK